MSGTSTAFPPNLFNYGSDDHDTVMKDYIRETLSATPLNFLPIQDLLSQLFHDLQCTDPPTQIDPYEPFYMLSLICDLTPVQFIPQLLRVLHEHTTLIRDLFSNDAQERAQLPEHLHKFSQKQRDKFIRFCSKAMTELLNRCKNVDYEQRGKIYVFLQRVLPLFEKSQMNLLGEINQGIILALDENDEEDQDAMEMQNDAVPKITSSDTPAEVFLPSARTDIPYATYANFWKLQSYIRNIKDIFTWSIHSSSWKEFTNCLDSAIQLLRAHQQHNDSSMEELAFNPTYLTDKNLFYFQLRNPSFKRQVLWQICVLCASLERGVGVKGAHQRQFSAQSQSEYVRQIRRQTLKILRKLPDSERSSHSSQKINEHLLDLLRTDHAWTEWKQNDACADMSEKPLKDAASFTRSVTENDLEERHPYVSTLPYGAKSLRMVMNDSRTIKEILSEGSDQRPRKRKYNQIASLDDSEEMVNVPTFVWNGLRLWAESDLRRTYQIMDKSYYQIIKDEDKELNPVVEENGDESGEQGGEDEANDEETGPQRDEEAEEAGEDAMEDTEEAANEEQAKEDSPVQDEQDEESGEDATMTEVDQAAQEDTTSSAPEDAPEEEPETEPSTAEVAGTEEPDATPEPPTKRRKIRRNR